VFGPLETFGLWLGVPPLPNNDDPNATSAVPEGGDIALDYLTDGTTTEKNIKPFDGMRFNPAFTGDGITGAKSLGLESIPRVVCAPATPTWEKFQSGPGTFNNDQYFGGGVESHTTYAGAYVTNPGAPLDAVIAIDSDDTFIAYLNGTEAIRWEQAGPCDALLCGRGMGGGDPYPNRAEITIPSGESFLLTRVHDGYGGSGCRVRFETRTGDLAVPGTPILPPTISISTRSTATPPPAYVRRIFPSPSYKVGEPFVITLRIEASGSHSVSIKEVLPAGDWSATDVSDGGLSSGSQVNWTLANVSGVRNLSYTLVPGTCPAGGSYCGNGVDGSEYTVDGSQTHALNGDSEFTRNTKGTDDLGAWDVRDFGYTGGGTQRVDARGIDVTGAGQGVAAKRQDQIRYVSVQATGNFELSTKIECMDDPGLLGHAGIMIRGDTAYADDAATAMLVLTSTPPVGGGGIGTLASYRRLRSAQTTGVKVITDAALKDVDSLPIWLKVKKAVDPVKNWPVLTFQRSVDGVNYLDVVAFDVFQTGAVGQSSPITLPDTVLIGLSVTGGGGGSTLASFRDVSGNIAGAALPEFTASQTAPNAPTNVLASAGNGTVNVTWSDPVGGSSFTGFEVVRDGATLASVPSSQHSYADNAVTNGTQYCYVVRATKGALKSANSNQSCATPQGGVGPTFKRGDVDGTGLVELTDVVNLLGFLFQGVPATLSCPDAADADDTGIVELTDAIFELGWMFRGDPANLPAPGPFACGADPTTGDTLPACTAVCQ